MQLTRLTRFTRLTQQSLKKLTKRVKRSFKITIMITGVSTMLSGCAGHNIQYYKNSQPTLDIQRYFDGKIEAWGLVQDWRGRVINQFTIEMEGTWEGDIGTLKEDFTYFDGKQQQRIWTIHKLADGRYEGRASDIIDKAIGVSNGNAIRWVYVLDLPVGEKTYRIKFDDWMWNMKDGVVINRSYLKKFGLTVAELTLVMKKPLIDQNHSK